MLDIGEAPPTIKQKKPKKSKKEKSSTENEGASTDSDSEAKNTVFLERRDSQSSISSGPFSPTHNAGVGPIFQVSEENRLKKRRRDSGRLASTNSESSSVSPYAQRRTPAQISTPPQQFSSPQMQQVNIEQGQNVGGIYGDGQIYQEEQQQVQLQQQQQMNMQQGQAHQAGYAAGETMTLTMETSQQPQFAQAQMHQNVYGDQQQQQQQQFVESTPQQQTATTNLQLSQSQLLEIQEMFSRSPTMTQDDKVLILRFVSGNFERPANIPSIHRIPLYSEVHNQTQQFGDQKTVAQVQVDVYFELNYETGTCQQLRFPN